MAELDDLSKSLSESEKKHWRESIQFEFYVKLVAAALALIVAIMQFAPGEGNMSTPQIVGAFGALLAFFLTCGLLIIDRDPAVGLMNARQSLDTAREFRAAGEEKTRAISQLQAEVVKSIQINQAHLSAREHFEQAMLLTSANPGDLIQNHLTAAKGPIAHALGVDHKDRWTLCVYKAYSTTQGPRKLKLVAQIRRIECSLADAREWEEGVSYSGIALSTGREIMVADANDPDTAQFLKIKNSEPHDTDRYISAVSVPIYAAMEQNGPWGVVVATMDQAGHFSPRHDPLGGIHNAEIVRSVAGFSAMFVTIALEWRPLAAAILGTLFKEFSGRIRVWRIRIIQNWMRRGTTVSASGW